LLLLDNFEQLLPAGSLLTDLLQASTALKLLVTSRSPLHLRWEQEFAVSPLAVPPLTPLPPPASLVGNWLGGALYSAHGNASIRRFGWTNKRACGR